MKINEIVFDVFESYFNDSSLIQLEFLDSRDKAKSVDSYYQFIHSGEKTLLPSLEAKIGQIPKIISVVLATNWNKIYNAIMASYEPLNDFKIVKVGSNAQNETKSKTEDESDVKNKNLSSNSVNKTFTDIETTNSDNTQESTFGFNSDSPAGVPTDHQDVNSTEHIIGTGDKNKSDNTRNDVENTENTITKTTNDTKDKTGSMNETKSGLMKKTSQQLVEEELRLRTLHKMIDIICSDLDRLITLSIYD